MSVEKEHQIVFRDGLAWLDRQATSAHGKVFRDLDEEQQIAMLTPLCEAADSNQLKKPGARFFRSLKSMTADGYYTSRTGLVDELGYKVNMAMADANTRRVPKRSAIQPLMGMNTARLRM